ncbi:hypothetical protein SAMN05443287_102682 [Micromonospora phaseoli]|uniref:Uncharacterized protein n=1 Tax=Micromonospora phaseoli TaxID=1144548 RepID=A0A1H6VUJ3_9ACTN|nr:hypothetical protein [Micromonospora phaseoli]PZV93565.1 hypothetical protein CLV64_10924 [Micromonospora phaseoli]GIJ80196.1 hypothetical protein Xph01_46280 [Micromonospora phaseoli]SEJ03695.1 hypothetical protein SAMN05443287_102682 [Micromonospora phaseoli]
MTPTVVPPRGRAQPAGPPGLLRLRVTLVALVVLAAAGTLVQVPVWGRLLLAAIAAAIPGAVAWQHGRAAARRLLGLPGGAAEPTRRTDAFPSRVRS